MKQSKDGTALRSVRFPAKVAEALERERNSRPWRPSVNSLIVEAVAEKYMGGNRPKFPEDDE